MNSIYPKYPKLVEVDVTNVFAKTFTTSSGNEELCNPTGLELQKTPSFGLENVKAIYHAVGPIYSYYPEDEAESLLRSCYRKSMEQLIEDGYKSIAFPCISSGAYGYPLDKAVEIATDEVLDFLTKNAEACEDVLVCFYCYDEKAFDAYHKHLTDSSLLEKVNRL